MPIYRPDVFSTRFTVENKDSIKSDDPYDSIGQLRALNWTPTDQYLLDDYPMTAGGAYALRRMKETYIDSAMLVQDSSSNLANIGFASDGTLDTDTLLSFAAGGTLKVRNWMNANNAVNLSQSISTTTFSSMPTIVDSGTLVTDVDGRPALSLVGANSLVIGLSPTAANRVVYLVGDFDGPVTEFFGILGSIALIGYGVASYNQASTNIGPALTTGTKTLITLNLQSTGAEVYQDGVLVASGLSYAQVQNNVMGFLSQSTGTISEWLTYEGDDGSNIPAINTALMTYYDIV